MALKAFDSSHGDCEVEQTKRKTWCKHYMGTKGTIGK